MSTLQQEPEEMAIAPLASPDLEVPPLTSPDIALTPLASPDVAVASLASPDVAVVPLPSSDEATAPPTADEPRFCPIEDSTESIYSYRPGGLHPVEIGDVFADRYSIVDKLGQGGWSTVWIARDQQLGRYVALKIALAGSGAGEIKILQELQTPDPSCDDEITRTPQSMIPEILDHFVIHGPNSEHNAIVTAPAMMSLHAAKEDSYKCLFQLPVARAIAAQLVQTVVLLHDRGIVHGDIHIGNILLRLPHSLDALSIEEFYKRYKEPMGEEVKYKNGRPLPKGVPARCYYPAWLGRQSEDVSLPEARILLTDFGVAFLPSQERRCDSYTPHPFGPPESGFLSEQPLSFPADIWGLACTLWSLVADSNIFCIWSDPTEEQIELLGKLPAEWWERWQVKSKCLDADEARPAKYQCPPRTWDVRYEDCIREPREEAGMEGLGAEEGEAFLKLLKSMLKYLPQERISAKDVLNSESMQNWAIPELDNVGK